jgi:hypothetical protein
MRQRRQDNQRANNNQGNNIILYVSVALGLLLLSIASQIWVQSYEDKRLKSCRKEFEFDGEPPGFGDVVLMDIGDDTHLWEGALSSKAKKEAEFFISQCLKTSVVEVHINDILSVDEKVITAEWMAVNVRLAFEQYKSSLLFHELYKFIQSERAQGVSDEKCLKLLKESLSNEGSFLLLLQKVSKNNAAVIGG